VVNGAKGVLVGEQIVIEDTEAVENGLIFLRDTPNAHDAGCLVDLEAMKCKRTSDELGCCQCQLLGDVP
jgi:hypothetical protein